MVTLQPVAKQQRLSGLVSSAFDLASSIEDQIKLFAAELECADGEQPQNPKVDIQVAVPM